MAADRLISRLLDGSASERLAGAAAAAHPAGSGAALSRIVLVAVVVAAVGAFAALQLRARSRRPQDLPDWRTLPPGHEAGPGDGDRPDDDEALFGAGPLRGYWSPPGYGGSPPLPWSVHEPGRPSPS